MLHDRLYRLILALDDAQWEEKQHPRAKGGQFAKKGTLSGSVVTPIYGHGFKAKPGPHAHYVHPAGHEIAITPSTGKTNSGWIDPKSGKTGQGGVSLKEHFASLGLSPKAVAQTTSLKTKAPKPAPTFEHPNPNYAAAISKFGGTPVKETEASQHYKFPNGTLLAIKKKPSSMYSSLMKWAMTKPDGQIEKWKGHKYLETALLKAEGTPIETAPPQATPISGTAAYKKAAEKVTAAGFKSTGEKNTLNGKSGYDRYTIGSEAELKASVLIHPETGAFHVWKAGDALKNQPGAEKVGTGYSITGPAEQFDSAFEALHPRGPGGQFAKKPSEVLTPAVKDVAAVLEDLGATLTQENGIVAEFKVGDVTVKVNKETGNSTAHQGGDYLGFSYSSDDLKEKLLAAGAISAQPKTPSEILPSTLPGTIATLEFAGATSHDDKSDMPTFKIGENVTVQVNTITGNSAVFKNGSYVGLATNPSTLQDMISQAGASTAASQPPPAAKPPVNTASLTKTGPQLGSNPGGQYEDAQGQKFYVKQTQSEDHARNENLAAALYQLASTNTLTYRKSDDPKAVVTEMAPLAANNVSQLTPEQRKRARVDFATHAWLANWDAAGLTGDNVGVIKGAPGQPDRVATLDVGGSLAYRAKGGPKGHLFGNDVTEWNTLRDAVKNPSSAGLFKDMTPDELKASVAKVAAVKPDQIRAAVKDAGYEGEAGTALANKLIARRENLITRLNQEANKPKAPPAPPAFKRPFDKPHFDPEEAKVLTAAMPVPTAEEKKAIHNYTNGFYDNMNEAMRFGYHAGPKSHINHLVAYLDKASLPHDVVVSRKVKGSYAEFLKAQASHAGAEMTEYACASTSIDPQKWSGSVQMILRIPKGSKAAYVDSISANKGEREMLLQRGARYKVLDYEKSGPQGLPRIYCEVTWDK